MTDRVVTFEDHEPGSLSRRQFTLQAALAILAGCVITISDTACGSSSTTTPSSTPTATSTETCQPIMDTWR